MKKVLFASTILASLGSVAAAETGVTVSGYGRFGLQYYSGDTYETRTVGEEEVTEKDPSTTIHTRLRLNIDGKTETDTGVTFGGRIRLQSQNSGNATTSTALIYAKYEGLRVEVGNVNSALDSVELFYDAEIGLVDSSYGDSRSSFYTYATGSYGSNRAGVYVSYSVGGFTGRASYIDPSHYTGFNDGEAETSLALTYAADLFTVAAAATLDGAGIKDNDIYFIGAAYKLSDVATVGLNYIDEGLKEDDKTVTLYGTYAVDALTLTGYVAYNDADYNDTSTAFGIGAAYDLGGAKLTGSIQRDYAEETYADVGVRFDF